MFGKAIELVKKRYKLKPINFKKTKEIEPWIDEMFDLFNTSYAKLESFVAITDAQKKYFKDKYLSFITPEFVKFVVDENNKLVAFGIVMPSFARALQKAKGKLYPFGIFHLLKAKYFNDTALFYLIGITPEYQNKGVTADI